eukprot:3085801-Rhodomonas_salina.1
MNGQINLAVQWSSAFFSLARVTAQARLGENFGPLRGKFYGGEQVRRSTVSIRVLLPVGDREKNLVCAHKLHSPISRSLTWATADRFFDSVSRSLGCRGHA